MRKLPIDYLVIVCIVDMGGFPKCALAMIDSIEKRRKQKESVDKMR